ncbi:glycosyltransferase family 2 protein [Steroidobacter sp. S1-65]|uniref:Glycosyltransferase family 2 protein n=2 Tax=Steroidobacter gossypii TaxID=2805490 RepID=A0ABS1X6K8_9GAMM|nr:glycosyltransferase family 2 protein [Steroidobacter gossypii]
MSTLGDQSSAPKLSMCITTFNRAQFIGATLESILGQSTNECEVVVVDGASTDDTPHVVSAYVRRYRSLRYIRQETNNGIDRDYDAAVEVARGEYCWLLTDDDIMMPGAIAAVLEALQRDPSLVIVNAELRDFELRSILQARWLNFESDRVYGPGELDRLFVEIDGWLNCHFFIIRREIWRKREREPYYGSLLLYLGVIFQDSFPAETLLIARPCISYRRGNMHTFSPRISEIIWNKWPSIAESLPISKETRRRVFNVEPWRHLRELLMWRGRGYYSFAEYRQWVLPRVRSPRARLIATLVALLPGVLVNTLLMLYYSIPGRSHGLMQRDLVLRELEDSRFHLRNWLPFQREM